MLLVCLGKLKWKVVSRLIRNHRSEGDAMATATQSVQRKELDTKQRSSTSSHFEDALRQKIVGQGEAVQALVELYEVFCSGLRSLARPVGNLLFLGPTGSGKTRIVEAAAEILFGDSRALIKIDCAEFQHSHEIAKLIGSPPGYMGHRETHPLITQEELAKSYKDQLKLSFLLFDEIEKASDALWQLLLGMLDKATLTLGDNRRVDLSHGDFPDVEPGRGRDHGIDGRRDGVRPAEGQGGYRFGQEGGANSGGSGAADVFAGVYEPVGQGGCVSPIEA
jgi:transcriptional regulator with AAA-type ATPase domain